MSVAEIVPASGAFERTPPQDVAAEQCVLGGMLMSKDAISDVMEVIRPQDHYRPAHQTIHEAILELYGRGEPADAITVSDLLTKRGELARVGGGAYLHTLIASVPTAANAGYYARIVRERSILRRLVEAGTRIVQLGYTGDGGADELLDRAEAEIYGVADRRVSEDYLPLSQIMPGTLDEIEAIGSRGGTMMGVPTGFADLDALTNGLHPGQMIVIAARPAIGKALALDTPLPTPTGWTTMGDVGVGDYLVGADGKPTRVVAATGVMAARPCFEVQFDDGTVIVADADHQWRTTTGTAAPEFTRSGYVPNPPGSLAVRATRTRHLRQPDAWVSQRILTTAKIAATLEHLDGEVPHHSVAVAEPMDVPGKKLPFPPYLLGGWLGGGETRGWFPRASLSSRGSAQVILRGLGVVADKHIPGDYLRASLEQRRTLLAGFLDTAGTVTLAGSVQIEVTSRRLALDIRELVLSLGYRCGMSSRPVRGARPGPAVAYAVAFTTSDEVFRLERKRAVHRQRRPEVTPRQLRHRTITAVRPTASVPVRCVQVDNADHMYLASHSLVPTHNSTLALDLARAAAVRHGQATVIFSLEMSRNEITMRLLSAEARVALHTMRTGQMGEDDWARLARRMGEVADAPLFIDDSPNMSMMEIRAKCRRLKQRQELRLVIVDYLQLMSSPKRVESRQQEVSEMSRSLKLLAKELDVPVVAISQLNRGPEQRNDKRPMLSDLRESGSIEQDSDMVILLHREDAYERESPRAGEADLIVAKHRNGPTATVTVAFQGHYSRFVDMAPV